MLKHTLAYSPHTNSCPVDKSPNVHQEPGTECGYCGEIISVAYTCRSIVLPITGTVCVHIFYFMHIPSTAPSSSVPSALRLRHEYFPF